MFNFTGISDVFLNQIAGNDITYSIMILFFVMILLFLAVQSIRIVIILILPVIFAIFSPGGMYPTPWVVVLMLIIVVGIVGFVGYSMIVGER